MSLGRRLLAGFAGLLPGLACLAILGTATPSLATTLRRMDLAQLVAASDRVVHARVVDNKVYLNSTRNQIFTDTRFEVIEDAKGQGAKAITITQLGGRIDPYEVLVEGTPVFKPGEEVVLFTEPRAGGNRHIVGMGQGVMRVSEDPDTGQRFARAEVMGGVSFVGGAGPAARSVARLDNLLEEVRQIAAGARPSSGVSKKPATLSGESKGGRP